MTPDVLRDILDYQRQVLELFLTVASIFGGFAIAGMIALRMEDRRDRLHTMSFVALALAATSFIFATALDSIWLPVSRLQRLNTVPQLRAVLTVGDVIVWAVSIGTVSLLIAVGTFGFARSRRIGLSVLAIAIVAGVAFVLCAIALTRATAIKAA
jgi:hypothetical protein